MSQQETPIPVSSQRPVSPLISQQPHPSNSISTTSLDFRKRVAELSVKTSKDDEGLSLDMLVKVLQANGVTMVEGLDELCRRGLRFDFFCHIAKDILQYLPLFINVLPPVQNKITLYMTAVDAAYPDWILPPSYLVTIFANAFLPAYVGTVIILSAEDISPQFSRIQPSDINPRLRSYTDTSLGWQSRIFITLQALLFNVPTSGAVAWATPALHLVAVAIYIMLAYDWALLRSEPIPLKFLVLNNDSPAQASKSESPPQPSNSDSPTQASKSESPTQASKNVSPTQASKRE